MLTCGSDVLKPVI